MSGEMPGASNGRKWYNSDTLIVKIASIVGVLLVCMAGMVWSMVQDHSKRIQVVEIERKADDVRWEEIKKQLDRVEIKVDRVDERTMKLEGKVDRVEEKVNKLDAEKK